MNIVEILLPAGHPNRPGFAIAPRGVVWHRTGKDVGAIWLAAYFGRDPRAVLPEPPWGDGYAGNGRWGRYGSAHYGVDDDQIVRYIPANKGAYHVAGDIPAHNRNGVDLGVELCQYFDDPPRIRPRTYANAVALGADLCRRYGWAGPRERDMLDVPRFTRHSDWDPVDRPNDTGEFLRWDDFLDDVERAIDGIPWEPKEERMTPEQDARLKKIEEALYPGTDGQSVFTFLIQLFRDFIVGRVRLQRSIDVERGGPVGSYDPSKPPIDPRVIDPSAPAPD